ncbi:MAG: IPTL-CTERM sorting domain-containing protein [Chthoniobacteraceae bacterium]
MTYSLASKKSGSLLEKISFRAAYKGAAACIAIAAAVFGAGNVQAQTTASFTTSGTQAWLCPSGVTSVQVEAWGAGGGSGGAGANFASTGGGAGGSYVKVTSVSVTPGTTYQLTVGAAGTAGAGGASGTGTTGGTGGSSYFGNTTAGNSSGAVVLAVGGPGSIGNNATGTSTKVRTVTAGATATNAGNVPSSGAAANTAGTSGATPVTNANDSGAGGAGAGASGSAGGGAGGAALISAGNGNAGTAQGGGGGGADQSSSASNGTGGAGGAGEVLLSYASTASTINTSGALSPVSTGTSAASVPVSFSASGSNLQGNIAVAAPTHFEISLSATSGYSSSLSLTQTSGTVGSTTVYLRIASGNAPGSYSGNVSLSSTSATTVNVAVPSCTVVSSFTAGDLAVEALPTSSTSSTINIIELNATAAGQSAPVNTFYIPSSGTLALRQSDAGSTGRLALSNDSTLLIFTGFEDATGVLDETSITQRAAASLDGNYDYPTPSGPSSPFPGSYTDSAGGGDQTRGATTLDNVTYYMSDKNGIWLSGTTPANTLNVRPIKSFGGTVYAMSDNSTPMVESVSADGTTLTGLPGLPADANAVDFCMLSSGVNGAAFDILYVLDGATVTKYSLAGGTWTASGTASAIGVTGDGFYAAGNGTGAYLYTTTGASGTVVRITDTAGYNAAPSINTANNVTLYTAPVGTFLKGVVLAPLVNALPDLTIGVSAPAIAGTSFNYNVALGNSGAASGTNVTAQFTLPAGLVYVSGSDTGSAGFNVANTGGTLAFTGGTLTSGTTEVITISVTGTNGSTYVVDSGTSPTAGHGSAVINTSAITATPITESNSSNNSLNVSGTTQVDNVTDFTVNTSGPATAQLGSNYNYTITAQNVGTISGTAAVQLTLPAGVTYVSGTDTGSAGFTASYASGVVTFSGGTIGANGTETLTVTVTPPATSTYRIFTVSLPAGAAVITPDGNTSTTAVTTTITLPSGPDLVVTSIPNGPFQAGDAADTFTIYASNNGTSATTQPVTVTETLPSGFTFSSASGSGWSAGASGQTVTATYSGAIAPGTGAPPLTITFSVAGNVSGSLSDSLTVTSADDAFTQNGTSTNTVSVGIPQPLSTAGSLIVTRAHYTGSASTIAVGQTLPNGAAATVSGAYPGLWTNETPDVSFGITAPVYMDVISATPSSPILSSTLSSTNLTSLIKSQLGLDVTTSFSSKSEVGMNLTPDGKGVTFMGYIAPELTLDVSNANTPYHDDPTSPLATHGDFQHAVVQVDYLGNVQVTPVDAYSGDNSRNVILAKASDGNSYYYIAGSAGNSGAGVTGATMTMLAQCTGVQMVAPGAGGLTTAVGEPFGTAGSTTGYQLGYAGLPSDKTGKDMNLRGLTLNPFNNTLYASKGSGGSGVDTIYQIGSGIGSGTGLPTPASASSGTFTIPSGFPTTSGSMFPFGMWFANAHTLYVTDEGEVPSPVTYTSGTYTQAIPANNLNGGLQKWTNSQPDGSGTWTLAYTLQNGLNLGQPYSYAIGNGYPSSGTNPATGVPWQPANNGLRNMAAHDNGDGTVTIYAVTATISGETDIGADPNQLVSITDNVAATSLPGGESFTVLEQAGGLDVLRGVALAQAAPVNSQAASNVSVSGATLSGSLNPNGTDTMVYFEYGTSTGYGTTTATQDLGSGSSPVGFNLNLTGLQSNTTYDYRLVVVANGVTTTYANQTFTTSTAVPAMPHWAFVILAAALIGVGATSLRRKKQSGAC